MGQKPPDMMCYVTAYSHGSWVEKRQPRGQSSCMKHLYVGQIHKPQFLEINVYSKIQIIEIIGDDIERLKNEENTRKMKAIKTPRKGSQTPDLLSQATAGGCQTRPPSLLLLLRGLAIRDLLLPRTQREGREAHSCKEQVGISIQTPFLGWSRPPNQAYPGPSFSRVYPKERRCSGN